jgi:hypothetical protein
LFFLFSFSSKAKEREILDSFHTPFLFQEERMRREKEAERISAFFCPLFCFFFLKRKRWRRKRGIPIFFFLYFSCSFRQREGRKERRMKSSFFSSPFPLKRRRE